MTRRDFELIARAIRSAGACGYTRHVSEALARELKASDPRFDPERFLAACEGERTNG
jgi:hypothetical protein